MANYERVAGVCVSGGNLGTTSGQTVEECAAICDATDNCLSFEYGVAYGGSQTTYSPGDCVPQSGAAFGISGGGCDGTVWNTDTYVLSLVLLLF